MSLVGCASSSRACSGSPWCSPARRRSVPPPRRAPSPPEPGARGCPAIRASFPPGPPSSGPHRRRRPCRSPSRSSHAIPRRWRQRRKQVSDPKSPDYRHFLTPTEFAQEFGPTPATIAQVTSSLRAAGPDGRERRRRPDCRFRSRAPWPRSSPPSRRRSRSTACPRERPGTTTRRPPRCPSSVAPQIEGILGLDTLSPPQPSTSVPAGESGHGPPRCRPGNAGAGPGPARRRHGTSCTSQHQLRREQHRRARCPRTGPGVRVRLRSTPRATTGRAAPSRWSRCRGGLLAERHQPLRPLLRHHARRTGRSRR